MRQKEAKSFISARWDGRALWS